MSSSNPKPISSEDVDDKKGIPIQIQSSPGSPSTVPPPRAEDHQTTSSSSTLGGLSATPGDGDGDGDEDGFRTPTGSGHRIPEARACPPAPRKPTARSLKMRPIKRRASTGEATWKNRDRRIQVLVDLSDDVESLFPPVVPADLTCKIKKARTV